MAVTALEIKTCSRSWRTGLIILSPHRDGRCIRTGFTDEKHDHRFCGSQGTTAATANTPGATIHGVGTSIQAGQAVVGAARANGLRRLGQLAATTGQQLATNTLRRFTQPQSSTGRAAYVLTRMIPHDEERLSDASIPPSAPSGPDPECLCHEYGEWPTRLSTAARDAAL